MRRTCIAIAIAAAAGIAACVAEPSTGTLAGALEAAEPVEEPLPEEPLPEEPPPPEPPPAPEPPSWMNPTCPEGQLPTGFGSSQCMQCVHMGGDSSEGHAAQLCLAAAQNCVGHIGGDATTMALACCERMGHEHAVVWGIYWSVGLCQSYVRFPDLDTTSDSAP